MGARSSTTARFSWDNVRFSEHVAERYADRLMGGTASVHAARQALLHRVRCARVTRRRPGWLRPGRGDLYAVWGTSCLVMLDCGDGRWLATTLIDEETARRDATRRGLPAGMPDLPVAA